VAYCIVSRSDHLDKFKSICIQVREFRHTVSHEYLQQYTRFYDQQT